MWDWISGLWQDSWLQDFVNGSGQSGDTGLLGSIFNSQNIGSAITSIGGQYLKNSSDKSLTFEQQMQMQAQEQQAAMDRMTKELELKASLGAFSHAPQPPYMAMQEEENKRTSFKGLMDALGGAASGRTASSANTNNAFANLMGALNK